MNKLLDAFGPGAIATGESPADWREAVAFAGDLLVASGRVTVDYTAQMIAAVEEFGPYIVIAPGIALAHARTGESVLETGLALLALATPVEFGNAANDPVRLVFALSAVDHDSHIEVMSQLASALTDPRIVNSLLNATEPGAIRRILAGDLKQ